MSSDEEMKEIIKKIKPVIERMSLDLYKKKPEDVVRNRKFFIFFPRQNL